MPGQTWRIDDQLSLAIDFSSDHSGLETLFRNGPSQAIGHGPTGTLTPWLNDIVVTMEPSYLDRMSTLLIQ